MKNYLSNIFIALTDTFIVFGSFLLCIYLKPEGTTGSYLKTYIYFLTIFLLLWFSMSLMLKKFQVKRNKAYHKILFKIFQTNLIILGLGLILMYGNQKTNVSRFLLFGTTIIATIFEAIIALMLHSIKTSKIIDTKEEDFLRREKTTPLSFLAKKASCYNSEYSEELHKYIVEKTNEKTFNLINDHVDLTSNNIAIISTTSIFNVLNLELRAYQSISNLEQINNIRYINKFFEAINSKLEIGGTFIGSVETKNMRKKRIYKKYFSGLNLIVYFFDFIIKRIFPKFNITKKLYFYLTKGKNRVLTKAETLGRVYSCGFEIVEEKKIGNLFFFVIKKIKEPAFDPKPTYGPLVRLKRIGKNGKIIHVYKMRTMHPYSEYLQDYIYQKYALKEGGKFKNDFRITTTGKIMRKFWIDELPMLINILKGEMKIVGVRPLSNHYFNLYSKELQEKRIKTKPGLIPPFYADTPKTLEEIQQSELNYLEKYLKKPFKTDTSYFFKALINIVLKNKRSS